MSELMREARIRVGEGDHPLVIDAGTAPDAVFSAMADERRRHVLAVISGESDAMDVSTVVERVAERMMSDDSESPSELATRRLSISLYHRHLPKMASAGLIEYDTENQTIEATQTMEY